MNVIIHTPPMFDEIDAVFKVRFKPVIFCWGHTIYNPMNIEITDELIAHERVHSARQERTGIEPWWKRYLVDVEFRLDEELPAHKAEYQHYCRYHPDRNARARFLEYTAQRLAGPLYGGLISTMKAKRAIMTVG